MSRIMAKTDTATTGGRAPILHRVKMSPMLYSKQLGANAYGRFGSVMELLRNGWAAGVPIIKGQSTPWDHRLAAATEIRFPVRHPLDTGQGVMMIKDDGLGIMIERFSGLGREYEHTDNGGANQNRMGRLAAIGLNRTEGIAHWLTRRTATGEVTRLTVSDTLMAEGLAAREDWIGPDDPLLGPYRGITGTFTIVVIPNPAITAEEILRELPWVLPRGMDRSLKVSVNGGPPVQAVRSPTSCIQLTRDGKSYDLFVGLADGEGAVRPGIALCDEAWGLVVGYLPETGIQAYPANRPDLCGHIRIPGLLAEMNTTRQGLRPDYWRTPAGKELHAVLTSSRLKAHVMSLLGTPEHAEARGDKLLQNLRQLFTERFGPGKPPDDLLPRDGDPETDEGDGATGPAPDRNPKGGPPRGPRGGSGSGGTRRRRAEVWYQIGNRSYRLIAQPNPMVDWLAHLSSDGYSIEINLANPAYNALSGSELMTYVVTRIVDAVATDGNNGGGRLESARNKRATQLAIQALGKGPKPRP